MKQTYKTVNVLFNQGFRKSNQREFESIIFIKQSLSQNSTSQKAWKSLGEVLKVFTRIQQNINQVPFNDVFDILKV